ncbi:MAG: metal-dependent hydrolase [Desulfobacteraceae bacterium]|jgi:membrane-bound metal-dependent hydrolase YbcI (DUF457 family)
MPLPLGHTAIGWAAYKTTNIKPSLYEQHPSRSRIVQFAFVTLLANLPDLDILFGLIFFGNGSAVHRGPTHSLLFALLAGYLASNLYRLWHQIPRFSFGLCFILIFSHVGADMLLTATPVSLLWPLDLYFSPGHNSWGQIMHMVLFQSIQDVGIVVVCIAYVVSIRYIQSKEPLFPLFAFARRRAK